MPSSQTADECSLGLLSAQTDAKTSINFDEGPGLWGCQPELLQTGCQLSQRFHPRICSIRISAAHVHEDGMQSGVARPNIVNGVNVADINALLRGNAQRIECCLKDTRIRLLVTNRA